MPGEGVLGGCGVLNRWGSTPSRAGLVLRPVCRWEAWASWGRGSSVSKGAPRHAGVNPELPPYSPGHLADLSAPRWWAGCGVEGGLALAAEAEAAGKMPLPLPAAS